MPLQCDICEGIRIVPMLLDVPTLRRNKFRDPRFMGTRRVRFRLEALLESCRDFGRAAEQHNPTVPPRKSFQASH